MGNYLIQRWLTSMTARCVPIPKQVNHSGTIYSMMYGLKWRIVCGLTKGLFWYSVNGAVRGELGRYPVMIKVLSNGLKFFQRLQNLPDSTLVKSSHQDVILQPQFFNKTSWLHKLDHCVRRFSCTFNDSATKLQSMMELNYKQAWLNTIHNGGKLRSYAVFKRDFFLEKYLLQESLVNRKNLMTMVMACRPELIDLNTSKNMPIIGWMN